LENALRFSPAEGSVEIVVDADCQAIRIQVVDQGPGMSDSADRLCQRGHRGDRGQTGLGLAIVSTIMARSGGELTLENPPAGGLVATLSWPVTDTV
jgi:two-component system OmpR family sensor kinase